MRTQFLELLNDYLNKTGIKRVHVASQAGISSNYLSRILSGTRNPSRDVVNGLAHALHLTDEQTTELLSSAGYQIMAKRLLNVEENVSKEKISKESFYSNAEVEESDRLIQQFYRLVQEIPSQHRGSFAEEMKCLFAYVRFKYVSNGGTSLLDIDKRAFTRCEGKEQSYLDIIAQIVGELHQGEDSSKEKTTKKTEQTLSTIDGLISALLSGEISADNYQPQLITSTLDTLRKGAPWEIRRRVTEALPLLCRLDPTGAEHLMESLRMDFDDTRGPDIRRRVIEALASLFVDTPQSIAFIIRLLQPQPDDDIYVALATIEVCGDIQKEMKNLGEQQTNTITDMESTFQQAQSEIAKLQRYILVHWSGVELESLQYSMALHNLLPAPDTLLLSLEEGIQAKEKLIQLVAVRYLERILLTRSTKSLQLYLSLLNTTTHNNVRRPIAKALPKLLQCLAETPLPTRALARSVILALATDTDIPIRRAVADHAMQLFYIDREFLLVLLQVMRNEKDQAIRYRLRPAALRLAQVWLIWYAETAGLAGSKKRGYTEVIKKPFGD